jgi:hypothetical protein
VIQPSLPFDPEVGPTFLGETYEPKQDQARLGRQLDRVLEVMLDHKWHSLQDISYAAKCPEASASARLRDLRRPIHKKGLGLKIEAKRWELQSGTWLYRWELE